MLDNGFLRAATVNFVCIIFVLVSNPLISSISLHNNIVSFLVVLEHVIDPNIDIRLIDLFLAYGTRPKSFLYMTGNQSLEADTTKMGTIFASNWNFDPFAGVRAYKTELVLGYLKLTC